MRVWVRLAEYQAWLEKNQLGLKHYCPVCPYEFTDEPNIKPESVQSDYFIDERGNEVILITQDCDCDARHTTYRCSYVPLQFIQLTEYDNSSFEPE